MISEYLTSMELNFLLYLARTCSPSGESVGIYYQEIIKEISCCTATFYEIRDSLTAKGFIEWEKNHSADIDIKLIGNDFTENGEIVYKDYLNTNIAMLNDKSFLAKKAGEKQMALYFLKRVSAGRNNKLWYIPFNQYKKLAELLRVSLRVVKEYIRELQRWIQVGRAVSEGKEYDVVTVLKRAMKEPEYIASRKGKTRSVQAYPEYYQHKHYIETQCRRNHIETSELQVADTATLIQQYGKKVKAMGKNIFNMVLGAIKNVNSAKLNSISVHKVLKNMIQFNEKIEIEG